MVGRIGRRAVLVGAGSALGASALAPGLASARPPEKVRQRAAIYMQQAPAARQCSACRLYVPTRAQEPAQCVVVEGPILASGGCVLWEPRAGVLLDGGRK